MNPPHTLLCLGDSYTIGEMVRPEENFPSQTIRLLRQASNNFANAEIIAKTGWTTDELQSAIGQHEFRSGYDFVTLLIGVNNQYRGRTIDNYTEEFESLLKCAIHFANDKANHVIVLSIPDWSVTPFAKNSGRVLNDISKKIGEYNTANKKIAEQYGVNYIDITPGTREALTNSNLLASDGLHPSAREYSKWSEHVAATIESLVK